jgi:dCMP deaminase
MSRPTWDETWLAVADAVGARSKCVRKYGAVIVDRSNRVVATGYNGEPATLTGSDGPCAKWCPHATAQPGGTYSDCLSIHAEANSLLFCDRRDREGGTMYVTGVPCWECAKLIANSGLAMVVVMDDGADYRDPARTYGLLTRCGIVVTEVEENE